MSDERGNKTVSSTRKLLRITAAIVLMSLIALIVSVAPASAGGATQISGIGNFDETGACNDAQGQGADFALMLTGDLEGCMYVFVETWECSPSGTYRETGSETYVLSDGTFNTTYRFMGKFEGCSEEGFPTGMEIFGRCQHPLVAGSGTGAYEGKTGRLHFKDDIAAGNFPYTGHLK